MPFKNSKSACGRGPKGKMRLIERSTANGIGPINHELWMCPVYFRFITMMVGMHGHFGFRKPVAELETKAEELRAKAQVFSQGSLSWRPLYFSKHRTMSAIATKQTSNGCLSNVSLCPILNINGLGEWSAGCQNHFHAR